MKAYKYTKEILEEAVKDVRSYRQLILKFGLKYPSGGAHSHFKKLITKYQIDTSHFLGQGYMKGKHSPYKHTKESFFEKVLCKDGLLWGGDAIKKKLFSLDVKERRCESCWMHEWLDKEIPLELHHLNGDRRDNRIENLQVICPNCHSITDNHGVRNIKR